MALQPQNERPFGFRDKLGYLFGDFGNDFTFIFAGSYLTLFYTDVLGVSAGRGRVHGRGHGPSGGYASAVPRRPVPAVDPARVRARGAGQRADVPLFCTQLALCGQGGLHVRHLYFLGQHLLYRHQYPIRFHGVGA